jgi:hypothetical protein
VSPDPDPGRGDVAGICSGPLGVSILEELRATMSRDEIARCLAAFGPARVDAATRRLVSATGGQPDLNLAAHRAAAITWLRAWGCRHLRRADTARTDEAVRAWWAGWGPHLPGEDASLTGLTEDDLASAGRALEALRAAPAASRNVQGRDVDVGFGYTAAGKLLFAIRPLTFPPWDEQIRLAFGKPGGSAAYVRLLRLSAAALDGLAERLSVPAGELPALLGRPASTPPKLVDEFLLARLTRAESSLPDS